MLSLFGWRDGLGPSSSFPLGGGVGRELVRGKLSMRRNLQLVLLHKTGICSQLI